MCGPLVNQDVLVLVVSCQESLKSRTDVVLQNLMGYKALGNFKVEVGTV